MACAAGGALQPGAAGAAPDDDGVAPGSEEARQIYARLYEQHQESMRAYEGLASRAGGAAAAAAGELPPRLDPSAMWAAYHKAYPPQQQQKQQQQGGAAGAGGGAGAVRASHYYEQVQPSSWRPDSQDEFLDLYRRCAWGTRGRRRVAPLPLASVHAISSLRAEGGLLRRVQSRGHPALPRARQARCVCVCVAWT